MIECSIKQIEFEVYFLWNDLKPFDILIGHLSQHQIQGPQNCEWSQLEEQDFQIGIHAPDFE